MKHDQAPHKLWNLTENLNATIKSTGTLDPIKKCHDSENGTSDRVSSSVIIFNKRTDRTQPQPCRLPGTDHNLELELHHRPQT